MPISVPDPVAKRGKADAKRHRDKQREAIKKQLPEIIANESIITHKKGKTIKIPIRGIEIPHFKPKTRKDGEEVGVGQGPGGVGDIIHRGPGEGQNGPGNEPGVEWIDSEIDMEELVEMMLEDLGLPNLEEKELRQIIVELGYKLKGITKTGPWALLDPRRTAKEGIKRFWTILRFLEAETGRTELECYDALKQSSGLADEALKILGTPDFKPTEKEIQPFPIISNEDLRFREIDNDVEYQSRAAVIAMMDVSGSMTIEKKYLARSMLFWLTVFLRKLYTQVEIRFIVHHTEARIVEEELFFKTGESGGTYCYSAYELANTLVDNEYDPSSWNVYVIHFSDGEDFDTARTVVEVQKLLDRGINMLGYGEIQPGKTSGSYRDSDLFHAFLEGLAVENYDGEEGLVVAAGEKNLPFVGVVITDKKQIWPALRELLMRDRWVNE